MAKTRNKRERFQRFNLVTGEDTYAGQNSQDPRTSRRVLSLIPSLSGELAREKAQPTYLGNIGAVPGFLFEYDRTNVMGTVRRYYFTASSTVLYLNVSNAWVAQTLPLPDGTTSAAALKNYPQAVTINNLMHISDGVNTWLFDGTTWVLSGMPIPLNAPSITTQATATKNITSISRRSGTTTVTLAGALSLITGTIPYPITLTIAGVTDTSFNGVFVATPVSSTVLTFSQPGLADADDTTGTGDLTHLTVTTNRYYWLSFLDNTTGRGLAQSDSSPISIGSGVLGGTTVVQVNPRFGNAHIVNATKAVTLNNSGAGGPTNETKAPTSQTNPDGTYGGTAFSNPANAYDGDPNTFSEANETSTHPFHGSCTWTTWAAAGGAYSSLNLYVTSAISLDDPGTGADEAVLEYSLDGGSTWSTILDLVGTSGASTTRSKTTDTISIPAGTTLANIRVRARYNGDSNGGGNLNIDVKIYEINTIGVRTGSSGGAGTGGLFTSDDVGKNLYIGGNSLGTIASVQNSFSATLTNTWNGGTLTDAWLVAPTRATHWVLYASESENSQVGFQLATIPITTMFYVDTSPFVGATGNLFLPIERPVRNDPPIASLIQHIHKSRIFRRRETAPRFINFTANEEVSGNLNGSPQESTPGTDPNTRSDLVNEEPYPDSSVAVRGIVSHGEALYLGTEQNILPLYGQSIDDFTLSQVVAFKVGFAGRYSQVSTPHGLAFVSYDKKVYLYPSQAPASSDSTQYLIELSRPKRIAFENMLSSDMGNVRLEFYNYGRRNWLILAFQDKSNVYHTWVYDFETQGWFELQRGVASLDVFEVAQGDKFLVGGGIDGQVYVLDDLTGTFTSVANLPAATFRTALMDWGRPDHYHVFRYVEFEVDNLALGSSITINYYLDPTSVDSPGTPSGTLVLSQVRGSNFFRGFTKGGALCYRMLLELQIASDQNSGVIRGLNIVADEAASLIF